MDKTAVKPVGIWIRVSTEDQAQGESPEHHEKRARFYADSKGWKVREVYHLEAVSGKSVMDHPETQRMLQDLKSGRITALIFSKLARLARNTKELLDFADIFESSDADLVSLQESIDTTTPAGRLFYTMIAAMAQWEREEIASRVAASVPIRAKLGKSLGGAAPFGYRWVDKKLIPDPQESPVRRQMYNLFLENQRLKTVARLLNEGGHRTRNGSKFSDTTVGRLLLDPSAKGLRRANYTHSRGNGKAWKMKPKEDWVFTEIEPIVSEDLWNQCAGLLEDRRAKGKLVAKKATQLFAGVTFCHCGGKMYVPSNTPKYVCYKCRNKMGVQDLEAIFQEQLKGFFFSSDEIANYLAGADSTIKEKEELLATLEKEEGEVKAEMDKVYRLYIDDVITPEGFGSRYKPLEARAKQIAEQIPTLQGEIDFLKIRYQSSDQILNEARDLYSRWASLSQEEKRRIVENLAEKITVGQNEVAIDLCYLPPSSEIVAKGQRSDIPALPFCHLRLKAPKPRNLAYPKTLDSLGAKIRERRLNLGLLQRQVAEILGVSESTVWNWETGRAKPARRYMPKILEFVGFKDLEAAGTLAGCQE